VTRCKQRIPLRSGRVMRHLGFRFRLFMSCAGSDTLSFRPETYEPTSAIHLFVFQRRATRRMRLRIDRSRSEPGTDQYLLRRAPTNQPVAMVDCQANPTIFSLHDDLEPSLRSGVAALSPEEPNSSEPCDPPTLASCFTHAPPPFAAFVRYESVLCELQPSTVEVRTH
jgi:hypothetical protein